MRRVALTSVVASLVLTVWSGLAIAKGEGPMEVMRPDGTVFTITSPSVDGWWKDMDKARCASCDNPAQAARLLDRVERAGTSPEGLASSYLILPEYLQVGWDRAWVLVPSTDRTSAYVVIHGGVGNGKLRWDSWSPATQRMEELIAQGDVTSSVVMPEVANRVSGRSRSVPLPLWAVVGAAVMSLVVAWRFLGAMRRRSGPV